MKGVKGASKNKGLASIGSASSKITGALDLAVTLKKNRDSMITKYAVVYSLNNRPKKVITTADTKEEAINNFRFRIHKGKKWKAFLIPDENEEAQSYYESLI